MHLMQAEMRKLGIGDANPFRVVAERRRGDQRLASGRLCPLDHHLVFMQVMVVIV